MAVSNENISPLIAYILLLTTNAHKVFPEHKENNENILGTKVGTANNDNAHKCINLFQRVKPVKDGLFQSNHCSPSANNTTTEPLPP